MSISTQLTALQQWCALAVVLEIRWHARGFRHRGRQLRLRGRVLSRVVLLADHVIQGTLLASKGSTVIHGCAQLEPAILQQRTTEQSADQTNGLRRSE